MIYKFNMVIQRDLLKDFFCYFIIFSLLAFSYVPTMAQNEWQEFNEGIADVVSGERFEVQETLTLKDGTVLAFIEKHTSGEEKDGVYQLADDRWVKIADRVFQQGFPPVGSDGEQIFTITTGRDPAIFELNIASGIWEKKMDVPDIGLELSRGFDILNGLAYINCRINDSEITDFPERAFQKDEIFVMELNPEEASYKLIRNPENPLIVPARGGNPGKPVALRSGKVYTYSTFDYRDKNGTGGIYEWDGSDWKSATAGLDAINTTGTGFGPVGPIYHDSDHQRLFVRTEQGFFEKVSGGWLKFFSTVNANIYINANGFFIANNNGDISLANNALISNYAGEGVDCLDAIRSFLVNNSGESAFAEITVKRNGTICDNSAEGDRIGIYRYQFNNADPASAEVINLHLTTGTYIGGQGDKQIAETVIRANGEVLVAGNFSDNMTENVNSLLASQPSSTGKILVMNEDGTSVKSSITLGDKIYDMDVNTAGEIALVGSFGVAVLDNSLSIKWHLQESTQERSRIAISNDGQVVSLLASQSNGAGIIRLYENDGSIIHSNSGIDDNGVTINDVEINSESAHEKYYVTGFTQVSSVLQVAFIYSYELTAAVNRSWKTWGFGSGEIDTNENGADTRAYRLKATENRLYVAGETAGGGPGGFTVFAYNGKDLSTPVAMDNNDFYTNGTNSCGPCHITFLGRINPENGEVLKGKFFHARLSNGKTNTHRVRFGDLEIDDENNVYVVGVSAAQIENRGVFNVNGQITGPYAGGDQFVLVTSPDFDNRLLWGVFSKEAGGGDANRIAVGQDKVVYLASATKGTYMTTSNAITSNPYNNFNTDNSLDGTDTYLAVWDKDIVATANLDTVTSLFVSEDECFRPDDEPCPEEPTDPGGEAPSLLAVSNILTPNGDSRNDTWEITREKTTDRLQVYVFDRTGSVLFETSEYKEEWNGSIDGKLVQAGTYYYTIYINDEEKPISGYLVIKY